MEKHYRFAGVEVTVRIPGEWMYQDDRQMASFRVERVEDPHVFTFEKRDKLTAPPRVSPIAIPGMLVYRGDEVSVRYVGSVNSGWEHAYLRAEHRGKQHHVQVLGGNYPSTIGMKTVLNALEAEHLVTEQNGFFFHCSFVQWNDRAILFTAPSETGKTTQAELWHQYRSARIINGDRAAVRLVDGVLKAEGIPFSGSSSYCENCSLPIAAVVYLGQAPQTTIRRMRGFEAFSRIWEGVSVNTWEKQDLDRVSGVVQQIAGQIPVYDMPCTPDEQAVQVLEKALRGLLREDCVSAKKAQSSESV